MLVPPRLWSAWVTLLVIIVGEGSTQVTELQVRLSAPHWASRGSSATLHCLHQVPPQLLYKVEFLRSGAKLLQYVRERVPPFTRYSFPGGTVNMSLTTESTLTIDNLDPTASGLYWCEVSLETPIFTAASQPHQLTVVYPQKHPPVITFGDPDVVVGGLLRANCTSAPAAPPPTLVWFVDDKQIPEDSVKYYSLRVSSLTRTKGGGYKHRKQHRYLAPELNHTGRYWALVSETSTTQQNVTKTHKCTLSDTQTDEMAKLRKSPRPLQQPPIQLWVSVLELALPAHGALTLTCLATIPDRVQPGEAYADVKRQTVTVAVKELIRPRQDATYSNSSRSSDLFCVVLLMSSIVTYYFCFFN